MKKKILVLTLMVALISLSVFAGRNNQNVAKVESQQRLARVENQQGTPLYVQVDEYTYKNVETNKIVSKENLPANCLLLDDDFVKGSYRNSGEMNKYVQNNQRNAESNNKGKDRVASNNKRGGRNSSNRNLKNNRN